VAVAVVISQAMEPLIQMVLAVQAVVEMRLVQLKLLAVMELQTQAVAAAAHLMGLTLLLEF
jgi:hypothetical protein